MNNKKIEFVKYVEMIMKETNIPMNEEAHLYWEAFKNIEEPEKPLFTDNGKLILKYLQEHQETAHWKSRDIAEGLFISSRGVSGAARKLVADGFLEKLGQDPVIYTLTEKGKNIIIE